MKIRPDDTVSFDSYESLETIMCWNHDLSQEISSIIERAEILLEAENDR